MVNSTSNAPQSIQDTRSFEDFTQSLEFLRHALNSHIHTACRKLRTWNGFCGCVTVMLKTKDFHYYALESKLPNLTNSDFEIRTLAHKLLTDLYRPNLVYRSTGITLSHLIYGSQVQQSLFSETQPHDDKLSHLVDELEAKFGKGIVKTVW